MLTGALVGINRQIAALRRGLPDRNGHAGLGWNLHIEGACGEIAVAKVLDRFWSASINTFKAASDLNGRLEIRTRSKNEYELIVRADDDEAGIYVLVTGMAPIFDVIGWIRGKEAKREEWWAEHGGRPGAWFVPHKALNNIDTLIVA